MKQQKLTFSAASIVRPQVLRNVQKTIAATLPQLQLLFPTQHAVVEPCQPHFFQFQALVAQANVCNDFGCSKVRVVLEGEEFILGIPIAEVLGDTIMAKFKAFSEMQAPAARDMATKTGFVHVIKTGEAVLIPGNSFVLHITTTKTLTCMA